MDENRVAMHAAELVRYMSFVEYRRVRQFLYDALVADELQHLGRELSTAEKDRAQAILSAEALIARS